MYKPEWIKLDEKNKNSWPEENRDILTKRVLDNGYIEIIHSKFHLDSKEVCSCHNCHPEKCEQEEDGCYAEDHENCIKNGWFECMPDILADGYFDEVDEWSYIDVN